nr:hypothetical protein [Bacteroidota bacterium]
MNHNPINNREELSNNQGAGLPPQFDLGLLFMIIKKSIWWGLLFVAVAFALALIFLRYTQPIFESSTVIQVNHENNASKVLGVDKLQDQQDISRDIELLKSKLFLKQALANLPLEVSYFNQGTVLEFEQYNSAPYLTEIISHDTSLEEVPIFVDFDKNGEIIVSYKLRGIPYESKGYENQEISLPHLTLKIQAKDYRAIERNKEQLFFRISNLEKITNNYARKLEIRLLNSSAKTIQILLKDYNPVKCKDIVDAIAEEFLRYEVERKSESAINVLGFIDNQIIGVYGKLSDSETSIQTFKTENKLSNDKDFLSQNIERFGLLESSIMEIELEESMLKEMDKRIADASKEMDIYNLLPIFAGTEYEGTITKLLERLHELLLLKEEASFSITPTSGTIKSLNHQINIQKKLLAESIESLIRKISFKKANLLNKAKEAEKIFLKAPSKEVEFARLQRHFAINEKFYNLLMEKRTEYSILKASFVPQNLILDRGYVAVEPIYPSPPLIITIFILAGFLITIGMIII